MRAFRANTAGDRPDTGVKDREWHDVGLIRSLRKREWERIMDYTTSVGYGLAQHRAADLAHDGERRRSIGERLDSRRTTTLRTTRPGWLPTARQLRSPRFVLPVVGIAFMGSVLGFAALPQDGGEAPVAPAEISVVDAPAGGFSGARFIAR